MRWPSYPPIAVRLSVGMANADISLPPMNAVPQLDMARFAGRWHEIARLPSPSQRLTDRRIAVTYTVLARAQVHVQQVCEEPGGSTRTSETVARRRYPIEEPGQFKRRTGPAWLGALPWAWSDYWALALDKDYRWMLLGDPTRRSLWMLSREPTMERNVLEALKAKARSMGYDLAPLIVSGELRSYEPV